MAGSPEFFTTYAGSDNPLGVLVAVAIGVPLYSNAAGIMPLVDSPTIIKVLGPGCTNCKNLERVTRQAVDALGIDATIEKVTDYRTIVGYGVMATPALVDDEKLVLSGRVPRAGQVRELLAHYGAG